MIIGAKWSMVSSFDIFDTLITRCTSNPQDIFFLAGKKLGLPQNDLGHFVSCRVNAERHVRETATCEEVTLDDIVIQMHRQYDIFSVNELREAEVSAEYDMTIPRLEGINLFYSALERGEDVVLISDMYLPRDVVIALLDRNGISGYRKLYLSSEIKLTKSSGNMYRHVLRDLRIDASTLTHFGDNKFSDVLIPRKMGIRVCPQSGHGLPLFLPNKKIKDQYDVFQTVTYSLMKANNTSNEAWKLGFRYFGPLLFGFCHWLHQLKIEHDINKLFFLSRDGLIIKRAYEILFPEEDTRYMYASRRSTIVPTYWMTSDVREWLNTMSLPYYVSPSNIVRRLGVDPECDRYSNYAKDCGLNLFDDYRVDDLLNNKKIFQFLNLIRSDVISNSMSEFEAYSEYLKQNISTGDKCALVDVGWYGNMQASLTRVLKESGVVARVIGAYTALRPEGKIKNELEMYGYLFDGSSEGDSRLSSCEDMYNPLYESFFMASHGSVKRFMRSSNGVACPVFSDPELKGESLNKVAGFQWGALAFVMEASERHLDRYFDFAGRKVAEYLNRLGLNPRYEEALVLGDIAFFDVEKSILANPKAKSFYLLHPAAFIKEFEKAPWKPGFLRLLFRGRLNFGKLCVLLRRAIGRG